MSLSLDPVTGHPAGRAEYPGREERVTAHVAHRGHETTVCLVPKYSWTAVCATPNNGLSVARIYKVSSRTVVSHPVPWCCRSLPSLSSEQI